MNIPISTTIGQKLQVLRKSKYPNDTQSDFAARIKTSSRTYSRMEAGDINVSLKNYLNAAEILNISERFETLFDSPLAQAGTVDEKSIESTFSDMFNRNKE
jgi:transcriptional regulator with XRE-family HTH domain